MFLSTRAASSAAATGTTSSSSFTSTAIDGKVPVETLDFNDPIGKPRGDHAAVGQTFHQNGRHALIINMLGNWASGASGADNSATASSLSR